LREGCYVPLMKARSTALSFLIVVLSGLCLYLPLLTKNYDLNGLAEAAGVESGRPVDLWNPNHMLYRPVGYVVRQGLAAAGIAGGSITVLQILSAIFGALGLGFVYLALERLTGNRTIAIWTSLMLGVSWSYWTLSTDVYYFSMSAMFVAASLAAFVRPESGWSFAVCGLLTGLSILACQANVVLIPGFTVALLFRDPSPRLRTVIHRAALIWISAGAVVAPAFAGTGILVYGQHSVAGVLNWGSRYSGNRLPMWGAWWPPSRLLDTAGSAFKSILGMDFWMFRFFLKHLRNGELPAWVAPLGFVILACGLTAAFRRGTAVRSEETRKALWLLILYCAYLPFVAWWESIEPRWFIMPNIFLAGLTAIVWSRWSDWRYFKFALPASVVILGSLNLAISAGPKHFERSTPTEMAACVADHMKENDLFLATEWNWSGYLHYVHGREVVSFIEEVSAAGNKSAALQEINNVVRERRRQGAQVYIIDIKSYSADYMKWLKEQTGLTAEDLNTFKGSQAFECVYSNFLRLN
jgi:hypothetical protein